MGIDCTGTDCHEVTGPKLHLRLKKAYVLGFMGDSKTCEVVVSEVASGIVLPAAHTAGFPVNLQVSRFKAGPQNEGWDSTPSC